MEHQHAPGASRVAGRDEPLAKARSLRRRKVITAVVITGFLVDGFFAALYAVMDARAYAAAIGLNLLNAALWAVTLLLLRWSERLAGAYFLLVLIAGMASFTILLGHASGSHLFLFLAASMSLIFLDLRPTIAPVAMTLLAWGALIISAKFLPRAPSHIPMSIDESEALFYVTSALTMVVLFVTSRYFMQLTDAAEAALELEYRRSDALLLNILPAPVAERLKHGERIADNYGSISCFSPTSSGSPPARGRPVRRIRWRCSTASSPSRTIWRNGTIARRSRPSATASWWQPACPRPRPSTPKRSRATHLI
jgi:adenylate cyclase